MAHVIDPDACISCGACEAVCPTGAISEADDTYKIDPTVCNDCADKPDGPQCEAECPSDAISKAD